jgi:hypothetical protein
VEAGGRAQHVGDAAFRQVARGLDEQRRQRSAVRRPITPPFCAAPAASEFSRASLPKSSPPRARSSSCCALACGLRRPAPGRVLGHGHQDVGQVELGSAGSRALLLLAQVLVDVES